MNLVLRHEKNTSSINEYIMIFYCDKLLSAILNLSPLLVKLYSKQGFQIKNIFETLS